MLACLGALAKHLQGKYNISRLHLSLEIGDTSTKENNVGTLKLNTRIETDCKNNDS